MAAMQSFYVCSRCQARQRLVSAARPPIQLRAKAFSHSFQKTSTARPRSLAINRLSPLHDGAEQSKADSLARRHQSSQPAPQAAQSGISKIDVRERQSLPSIPTDNLFHPLSTSPSTDLRQRAQFIKRNAFCPHPSHQRTRVSEAAEHAEDLKPVAGGQQPPAHCKFECPDCGIPLYCSEEHWADDYESHLKICDTLRQINEDDHDLRSGRRFSEFEYPGPQVVLEAVINMTNWDTFLYTRQFDAINEMQRLRQATRLLTYPVTVGSVIHELSPYQYGSGGRVTLEGVKSFSALQYTLHPPRNGAGMRIDQIKPNPPMVRVFVLGARAESSLPRDAWLQLVHMFPSATINLIFVGPDAMMNREDEGPLPERTPENPFGQIVEDWLGDQLKINTFVDHFHNIHQTGYFAPYDPYFDCFMLYHPGFGNPISAQEWEPTIPQLLETKVPIICTGFTQQDMTQDISWVKKNYTGEFDMLLEPGENVFRSLRWDLNEQDPADISCANWGVWAFRGKRYDTLPRSDRIDETRRLGDSHLESESAPKTEHT